MPCRICKQEYVIADAVLVAQWSTSPPPVDADQYKLFTCACGSVMRKADGKPTADPRWSVPLTIGGDRV